MNWKNAEWANDLKLHLESRDMPEMPERPPWAMSCSLTETKHFWVW